MSVFLIEVWMLNIKESLLMTMSMYLMIRKMSRKQNFLPTIMDDVKCLIFPFQWKLPLIMGFTLQVVQVVSLIDHLQNI